MSFHRFLDWLRNPTSSLEDRDRRTAPADQSAAEPNERVPDPSTAALRGDILNLDQLRATIRLNGPSAILGIDHSPFRAEKRPRKSDTQAPDLPDLIYGYPELPRTPPPPAPFVPCKIYWGQYQSLEVDQRRYFLYWRDRFNAGECLPATDTYLFIAAYDTVVFARKLEDVLERWTHLWRAYPEQRSFRNYAADWITDARFFLNCNVYDDITTSCLAGQRRFDASLRASRPPDVDDVVSLIPSGRLYELGSRRQRVLTTLQALRDQQDVDPFLELSRTFPPNPIPNTTALFRSLATIERLGRLLPQKPFVSWYLSTDAEMLANELFAEASAFWVHNKPPNPAPTETNSALQFVETPSTPQGVPIRRGLTSKTTPEPDTIEGLRYTLALLASSDTLTLMGLVLHLADRKPYIEGDIILSTEGRGLYAAASQALQLPGTLSAYRQSFYELTQGPRAPWTLSPSTSLAQMRLNQSRARFTIGLQHALIGSRPRGELYRWICDTLATHLSTTPEAVADAFRSATVTGHSESALQ